MKILNAFKLFTIFRERSILHISLGSQYASALVFFVGASRPGKRSLNALLTASLLFASKYVITTKIPYSSIDCMFERFDFKEFLFININVFTVNHLKFQNLRPVIEKH